MTTLPYSRALKWPLKSLEMHISRHAPRRIKVAIRASRDEYLKGRIPSTRVECSFPQFTDNASSALRQWPSKSFREMHKYLKAHTPVAQAFKLQSLIDDPANPSSGIVALRRSPVIDIPGSPLRMCARFQNNTSTTRII